MKRMAAWVFPLTFAMLILLSHTALSQNPSPQRTRADAKSKTMVDMTTVELLRSYRQELSNLEFGLSQDRLHDLLEKAGERVSAFVHDLSNTAAQEQVLQRRFSAANRLSAPIVQSFQQFESTFNYLILPRTGKGDDSFTEYRTGERNRAGDPTINREYFIMSSGYAALCLYLHPGHQANSNVRYLGRETKPPGAHVLAFVQKPESGDYLAQYYYNGRASESVRFLVQGFIWVHPDSFQILRMRTSMYLPEKKTVLKEQITDVLYEKVEFDKTGQQFWLPQEVNVSWEFPDWVYRNRHRYSGYRLFSVESDYKITPPKIN